MDSKKLILVIVACFGIMLVWQYIGQQIWPAKPEEQQNEQTQQKTKKQSEPTEAAGNETTPKPVELSQEPVAQEIIQGRGYRAVIKETQEGREDIYIGSDQRGSGYKLRARLSSDGAGISQAWLTEFAENSEEYKYSASPYGDGRKRPVQLLNQVEGRAKGKNVPVDDPPCLVPLATSQVRFVRINPEAEGLSREELAGVNLVGEKNWALLAYDEQQGRAVFGITVLLQQENKTVAELLLKKTYTLAPDSYDINVELELTLAEGSAANLAVELVQDGPTGMGREGARSDMREGIYGVLKTGKTGKKVTATSVKYKDAVKAEGGMAVGPGTAGKLLWAGTMNKFFGAYLVSAPEYISKSDEQPAEDVFTQAQIIPIIQAGTGENDNVMARLVAPTIRLEPGKTKSINMKLFLGPKERKLLKSGVYGRLKFAQTINSGTCCSFMAFGPITEGLLWVLGKIYAVIPNYGVGIIILVVLVRAGLHHFSRMSQVSMMRMSKLGPEIEKLKKKYGNNKEELSRAQMALYKEYKINPLSGCLPMALQMPIWIALYTGLNTAVELRHAPFFWWINNLAGADNITAYFAGGIPAEPIMTLPMLGPIWGLNVLPILLGVAFFLQQKFMPSAGAAASPQAEQTKKMMYFMMALFPLMLYGAPSGLNLYIMTSTFVGVIENHYIKKHIRDKEEAEKRPVAGGNADSIKSLKLKKR